MDDREDGKEVERTVQCRLGWFQNIDIEDGTDEHHQNKGEEVEDQHDGLSGIEEEW